MMHQPGRVDTQPHARADLLVLAGLLVHVDGDGRQCFAILAWEPAAEVVQEKCGCEPADGTAYYGDAEGLGVAICFGHLGNLTANLIFRK